MAFEVGQRVRLAADLRLASTVAGCLALAAGTEGTVERVDEPRHPEQSHEVREYVRLKSLLDDFGLQMPPQSRKQLEEQISSLEAEWIAYQEQSLRATVRVHFDNGFVLDGAHEDVFISV
ncbi:hypothetical protein [Streptomyces sp. NPDC002676]